MKAAVRNSNNRRRRARLGVGTSLACRDCNGRFSNDHGRFRTGHPGIGASSNLGGTTCAPVHLNAMMPGPTIEFDGEIVINDAESAFLTYTPINNVE